MMIVTAIIGILVAIAIPAYQNRNKPHNTANTFNGAYQPPEAQLAATPPAPAPLAEQCVNGFTYIVGNNAIIQKMGADGTPATCQ